MSWVYCFQSSKWFVFWRSAAVKILQFKVYIKSLKNSWEGAPFFKVVCKEPGTLLKFEFRYRHFPKILFRFLEQPWMVLNTSEPDWQNWCEVIKGGAYKVELLILMKWNFLNTLPPLVMGSNIILRKTYVEAGREHKEIF